MMELGGFNSIPISFVERHSRSNPKIVTNLDISVGHLVLSGKKFLMSRRNLARFFGLALLGVVLSSHVENRVFAVGYPVAVDPNCDDSCRPSCGQCFCRKLKLHCVYFKRACTQKYVVVPTATGGCPDFVPANCPTYSQQNAYPTINGYGNPHVPYGPNGVYIR